ncbi:MFS transporter [Phenylobacterium montanum]|uniref:MFS transporter n=1 Tax=Phenylobacterium montanum TaxID=2823693 RepID=A0A975IXC3_9CAUL|nr:MFS transporter [Caulobacter sp. S6]QUD89251.1 MFS transporter [Caulobacter sp. S6]
MTESSKLGDEPLGLRGRNWRIFSYFAPLTLLVSLISPHGNLADIAVTFMLKDRLHASATQVSLFRLIVTLPLLASMLVGLARDHWNPLGWRDRGHMLIFAALTAATYIAQGAARLSFASLVAGMLCANILMLFVSGAHQGLLALIGQENRMSGRLAVVWQTISYVPIVGGSFLGGELAERMSPSATFLILGAASMALMLFSLWKPAAVFDHAYDQPAAKAGRLWEDVRRLLRSRAIYAPILLPFLFNFSPGFVTPLQFHITNELHARPSVYGDFFSLYFVGFTPLFLLYGWLLSRVSFRVLLWSGLAIGGPNVAILPFIHSPDVLLAAAAPMGACAAIGWCAICDLAIRSCPRGLQGTLMLLAAAAGVLGYRFSDVLGARLYDLAPGSGFTLGIVISVIATLLCLPVVLLVPRDVMDIREGAEAATTEVVEPRVAVRTAGDGALLNSEKAR